MTEDVEENEEEAKSIFPLFMPRKSIKGEDAKPPPLWLLTFADVTALMLTFFVLLYSMSSPEVEKWEEMTAGINKGFDKFKSAKFQAGTQETIEIEKLDMSRALDLEYLASVINQLAQEKDELDGLVMFLQKDRLILSLPSNLLFESGQARVNADGKRALFALGGILSRIRNRMQVIGHTDPTPIQNTSGRYQNNRELSLHRATEVAAVLDDVGYKRSVIVRGLGSARYDELSDQTDEVTRLSLARRVDIVVLKDDGSTRSFMDMQ